MQHCVVTRPEHLKDEVKETQRAQVVILFLNCVNGFEKVAIIDDHNGVIDDILNQTCVSMVLILQVEEETLLGRAARLLGLLVRI